MPHRVVVFAVSRPTMFHLFDKDIESSAVALSRVLLAAITSVLFWVVDSQSVDVPHGNCQ
jgi:hypothetical protein